MRLSEAIRLGAMLKPQGRGELCTANFWGALTTCALGAAHEAVIGEFTEPSSPEGPHSEIYDRYRDLVDQDCDCPVCGDFSEWADVAGQIEHLNDDHRWTREQIADWVESIEPAETPKTETPETVAVEA